jgi:hypothetical protein
MGELIFIIGLIAGLILPFLLLTGWGRKFWVVLMSVIGLSVGVAEICGKIFIGKTISRMYWEWSLAHETTSWIVAIILICGWLNLIIHLQWKVIKKRLEKKDV